MGGKNAIMVMDNARILNLLQMQPCGQHLAQLVNVVQPHPGLSFKKELQANSKKLW